jgi:hypothetical protein
LASRRGMTCQKINHPGLNYREPGGDPACGGQTLGTQGCEDGLGFEPRRARRVRRSSIASANINFRLSLSLQRSEMRNPRGASPWVSRSYPFSPRPPSVLSQSAPFTFRTVTVPFRSAPLTFRSFPPSFSVCTYYVSVYRRSFLVCTFYVSDFRRSAGTFGHSVTTLRSFLGG